VCITIMLLGGLFWAYIIGILCSSIAISDKHGQLYKTVMDELSEMCGESGSRAAAADVAHPR
jgi:hypothetical protein